jgi:hypothetical protein
MKTIFQFLLSGFILISLNGYSQHGTTREKKEIQVKVENAHPNEIYHVKVITEKEGAKTVYEKAFGSLEEMESDSAVSLHVSGDQINAFQIQLEKLPEDFEWSVISDSLGHQVIRMKGGKFVFQNDKEEESTDQFLAEADSGEKIHSYEIRINNEGDSLEGGKEIKKEIFVLKEDNGHIINPSGDESDAMEHLENVKPPHPYRKGTSSSVKQARIIDISTADEDFSDFNLAHMPSLTLHTLTYYPNPNEGEFTLSFTGRKKPVIIRILDQKGHLMYEENLKDFSGYYNEVINVRKFNKGKYLLQIHQNGKVLNKKLILE